MTDVVAPTTETTVTRGFLPISPSTRNRILSGCGCLLLACLFCTMCGSSYYVVPWMQARLAGVPITLPTQQTVVQPPTQPEVYSTAVVPAQPVQQPTSVQPAAPTNVAPAQPAAGFNTNEPLQGSLDDFGRTTRHSDRFALPGTVMDESYNAGEIIVGNAYAIHDNGFVSQNGCVVFYYQAPQNGGRVRFVGYDGQFFEFNAGSISINQAIAAMRETLNRAHGCNGNIQYHELARFGDAVK